MLKIPEDTPAWARKFSSDTPTKTVVMNDALKDILGLDQQESLTLFEAKNLLSENIEKGTKCPCCHQYARLYKRPIHSTMAKMLVLFYKLSDTSWIHVNDVVKKTGCAEYKSGDWAKLKHWGLIEEKAKEPDEKNAGFWRITPLGCQFVEKQVYIKSHVLLYNGQFCGFTGDYIDIEHCLGKKISYTKLLKER